MESAIVDTDPMLDARDYVGTLARLAQLRAGVDAFFDKVMVNAPEPLLRSNRLALLGQLRFLMNQVADLAQL